MGVDPMLFWGSLCVVAGGTQHNVPQLITTGWTRFGYRVTMYRVAFIKIQTFSLVNECQWNHELLNFDSLQILLVVTSC